MEMVKFGDSGNELVTGDLTLKYCPDWITPRKKGRPKGNDGGEEEEECQ